VASFLAQRLEVDLQQHLDGREDKVSWPDLMREYSRYSSSWITSVTQGALTWCVRSITPSSSPESGRLLRLPIWDRSVEAQTLNSIRV